MLNHLKSEANIAYTEDGAVTNASTMSDCLDLFAVIGALRAADDQEIIRRFVRAYAEDASHNRRDAHGGEQPHRRSAGQILRRKRGHKH